MHFQGRCSLKETQQYKIFMHICLVMVYFLKVANESEVKGQVKLRFTDVVGKRYTVSRSMVSIQKVNHFTFY